MQWGLQGSGGIAHVERSRLPAHSTSEFRRRCLASPSLRQQQKGLRCPVVKAEQIKPAYNKYRSRYDIDQDYIAQWREVTARDSTPKAVTPFSFLWFIPVFVKYHLIPGPLRYLWWLIWSALLSVRYRIRKRLVLQGAKLDVQLRKSGKAAGPLTFSRAMVLHRLHGHVGPVQNLQYRLHLFQGLSEHVEEQAATVPA